MPDRKYGNFLETEEHYHATAYSYGAHHPFSHFYAIGIRYPGELYPRKTKSLPGQLLCFAEDVAASLNKIAFPPEGVVSPRSGTFMMVDNITATDPHTV